MGRLSENADKAHLGFAQDWVILNFQLGFNDDAAEKTTTAKSDINFV